LDTSLKQEPKRKRWERMKKIYEKIKNVLENARTNAYRAVNFAMVSAYWQIGKIIVEEEQKGKKRADYGKSILKKLSIRLSTEFGKGFDESNLRYIRLFYLRFQKYDALRHELSWTHYRVLLRVSIKEAREFYVIESIKNNWSTRELDRQINSMLFERLALSKDKKGVLNLSKKGQIVKNSSDLLKDPYILEFLELEDKYSENDLEQKIIDNLQKFLLELGKGFMFVERQKRITLDNEHFYIDLVFYNRLLQCFVIIELKIGKLTHKDLGQLQMYVNYYDREIRSDKENPTIGILLCADKKETIVKYTLPKDNKQIFASEYKLYLPNKRELVDKLKKILG